MSALFRRTEVIPHVTGSRDLETWDGVPERYRTANDGFGVCQTGWGAENSAVILCPLGGIGCNVDHIAIARQTITDLQRRQNREAAS